MNINLKLKLPLVSSTNPVDKKIILVSAQLLLNPIYALEEDVITPFTTLKEEQLPWVRKLLFDSSITVYRETKVIEKLGLMSKGELFSLRRDYVICMVTNQMAKQLYKDALNTISRSKSLGDFSVSTSTKADSTAISKIISDSNTCIDDMKKLIEDIEASSLLPATFVKGRSNVSTRKSARLWWHSDLPFDLVDAYASKRYWFNGNGYKASTFNMDEYAKYGKFDPLTYYKSMSLNGVRISGSYSSDLENLPNLDILRKIGEDDDGNLLFDNEYPSSGSEGSW